MPPSPAFPRYMVDAADQEKIEASKNELHNLLDKPQLQGIPVSALSQPTPPPRGWGGAGVQHPTTGQQLQHPGPGFCSPSLQVLVLGNKRDLPGALDEKELIEKM